jgi:acyl-coenzyme A thioesterase PaaI-like protein
MTPENPPALYQSALQDVWPMGTCYGCGPANSHGLHIKSYWSADGSEVTCTFHAQPHFNAGLPNVMYGGMIACLCDCHSVWTAMAGMYRREGREHGSAPTLTCVTGSLSVKYLAPTPLDQPVVLRAHVQEISSSGRRATVYCGVYVAEKQTAEAIVVAVQFNGDKSVGANVHGA